MGLSELRNDDIGIVEGLFIRKVLQDQADSILKDTARDIKEFKSEKWNKRSMAVSGDTLTYTHNIMFRFIDMRSRTAKSGYHKATRKRKAGRAGKKSKPIHNKPIFRHKKYIQRVLAFGFTEEVKANFEKMAKDANLLSGSK